MKNYLQRKFVAAFMLLFVISGIVHAGDIKVKRTGEYEYQIEYSNNNININEIATADGTPALLPLIDNAVIEGKPGSPGNSFVFKTLRVPSNGVFEIADLKVSEEVSRYGFIAPVPSPSAYGEEVYREYNIDGEAYSGAAVRIADVKYIGKSGEEHLIQVRIAAAYFDNSTKNLVIPKKLTAKINYKPLPDNDIRRNYTKDKNTGDMLLASSNWVKITVKEEGVYSITPGMLSGLGINLNPADIETIKIYGNGGQNLSERIPDALENKMNEQEIIVRKNQSGGLEEIIFYGSPAYGFEYKDNEFMHYLNSYSNENYYLLTYGGEKGKRAVPLTPPTGETVNKPNTYIERMFFEEELYSPFPYPSSGRAWFGRNIFPKDYTNLLPNLDPQGTIGYRFSVAQRAEKSGKFLIKESNKEIANISLSYTGKYDGATRKVVNAEFPAAQLSGNRSTLLFEFSNPAGASATGFLDWYEIHYPRSFMALNNKISFFSNPALNGITEYTVNEILNGEIFAWEVTDRKSPKLLKDESNTGGMCKFRTELTEGSPKRFFLSSKKINPVIEKTQIAGIRDRNDNSDVIVITHPDLLESAEKFANYRTKQSGLSVSIVTVDNIFNEFASGVPDVTAIRDYLAYAYQNWEKKPKYVVLWGDGHYDYKNIQYNNPNFVPPYESEDDVATFSAIDSYTTDDYYVRVSGNDRIIDMAIGRLTVTDNNIGDMLVEKISRYENSSSSDQWRTQVTLVADDSQAGDSYDRSKHVGQSETLSRLYIPEFMQQKKVYLPEYRTENIPGGKRKPKVTEEILSKINTGGTLFLNWIGHGNPRVWAHEEILDRDITVQEMKNLNKFFFLTAATCDYGRFDMPDKQSGAEVMLMNDYGGAIGVFTSARVVFSDANALINQNLYRLLFTADSATGKYPTLGNAMKELKKEFSGTNDEKFFLLGDPTLTLLIPTYSVRIDSINGIALADTSEITIKALSEARINATIIREGSTEVSEDFDGIAIITMLDGDEEIKVEDTDGITTHEILKHGGALNKSSYSVEKGKFTADFIIPKDISFSDNKGRLYTYAYSPEGKFAKGSTRAFKIEGISDNPDRDDKGPDIDIYLDARTFQKGNIVSGTPLLIVDLYDESGMNTTGRGIGHRIEAWIDDDPNSIDLTDNFKNSLVNPKAGTAEELLFGLEPGRHKIKLRAWDVYNNYSVSESYFDIASSGQVVMDNFLNYPNPVMESTTLSFNHNLSTPFDAYVKIYDIFGSEVKTIRKTITDLHTSEISWDCLDNNKKSVSSGVYSVLIKAVSTNGESGIVSGTISVVK